MTPFKLILALIIIIATLSISFSFIYFITDYTHQGIISASYNSYSTLKDKTFEFVRPDYPALVLQGPPKCGTRTFVDTFSRYTDVVQYGPERCGLFNTFN